MSSTLRAPLLWLLLPFMLGIVLADAGFAPSTAWLGAIALGAATGAWLLSSRETWLGKTGWSLTLVAAATSIGASWMQWRAPAPVEWLHPPRELHVKLRVEQVFPPAPQRKTINGVGRIVQAEGPAAELAGQRVYFSAIRKISAPPIATGEYDFTAVVEALPNEPSDERSFEAYLNSLGVRVRLMRGHLVRETRPPTRFQRFCDTAQDRLAATLATGLDAHPEILSLYRAMLLGEKAVLSTDQQSAFMRSGVFHIFSISGLHVGVIAVALLSALTLLRVPRRLAVVAGLSVLFLYVQITGGSTPAVRSFLMIAFLLVSQVFRLPGNPLAALAAAAFATLLLDPRQLFSTGLQMSYSVVLGLIALGIPLAERWEAKWRPWADLPEADWKYWQHWVRDGGQWLLASFAITWAATLASMPCSVGYFGLLSPGALLANLLIIPISSGAIISGFLAILGGLMHLEGITLVFNRSAAVLIRVMDWLVANGTRLPGVYFDAEFRAPWLTSVGLVLVLTTILLGASLRWRRAAGGFWPPLIVVALLVIFGVKFG